MNNTNNEEEYIVSKENPSTHFSSCYKCNRRLKIECYSDNCVRKENAVFLGDKGTESYSYCPYCGVQQTGFSPYEIHSRSVEMDAMDTDDEDEWDDEDNYNEEDYWWRRDDMGVTLVDEDEEPEDDEPFEMYPDDETEVFECKSCGESFRTSRKDCDKIYCYYCGKEIPSAANKSQNAMKAKGSESSNGKKAKGK